MILAGGPSLTKEDVDYCVGKAKILAIKDAYRMVTPDVLYGCDAKWWSLRENPSDFHATSAIDCLKFALEPIRGRQDVTVLRQGDDRGLSMDPEALATGYNSGYQAINLSVLLGASKIVLLGYDMQAGKHQKHHWFGKHPYTKTVPNYVLMLPRFSTLVEPLKTAGVSVLNASRISALECFPKVSLKEAL